MRARMGLHYANIQCEVREVILRNKPAHMLDISRKGTVPVICLPTGQIIDESLDILLWAVSEYDPQCWESDVHRQDINRLIERNDSIFKAALDRYKYPTRYPKDDCSCAREDGLAVLQNLNARIAETGALCGGRTTLADIAVFPFVRQFAHVDCDWFYNLPLEHLQNWLKTHLESELFKTIMKKRKPWQEGDAPVYLLDP